MILAVKVVKIVEKINYIHVANRLYLVTYFKKIR